MKRFLSSVCLLICLSAQAQDIRLTKYTFRNAPAIGVSDAGTLFEGGFSGLYYVPGSGNEFYTVTDRGPNADAVSINNGVPALYFPFPKFNPKIFRIRAE